MVDSLKTKIAPFDYLLEDIVDNRGKTCPTAESGIPLIATNCISNDYLYPRFINVRYVSNETYKTWFRGHPRPNDLIFVTKGTPGRVTWVPDPVDFCIAQDMVAIRPDKAKVYPRYLFAALRSKIIQAQIEGLHVGSLIPHFKKGDFKELQIPLPDEKLQKYIGDIYYELSVKIDLLHRQNKTLESLAGILFRQWFIIEASADWEAQTLGDFAENPKDSIKPQNLEAGVNYIGLEHIDGYNIALNRHGDSSEVNSNKYQFIENDILFGKLRPYFHKVCIAPFNGVCSTDILVIRPKKPEYLAFCLFAFFQKDVIEYATAGSGGTRMPRTNWQDLSAYPMQLPKEEVIERFNETVMPFIERIKANIEQIRILEQLRDTLLPKLMTGEVRVQYDTSQKTEAA